QKSEKISRAWNSDGQTAGNFLSAGFIGSKPNHFENVRALRLEASRGFQPLDKITTAQQAVLLAIECYKCHVARVSCASLRATKHGGDGAGIIIRARATADAVVMRANQRERSGNCFRQCDDVSPMAL